MGQELLRIGIVGCGGIAQAHRNGYEAVGGNRIAAVWDPKASAAAAMAAATGAEVVASPTAMLAAGIDAVSICSPPAAHRENAEPFLRAGVAVLCEKPLGVDGAGAAQLAAVVAETGTLLMTAFCHRFHPPIVRLKELLDAGDLGRPLLFRNIFGGYGEQAGNHRADPAVSGGGPLIDHCSHSVDLFCHLIGIPTRVQAIGGNLMQDLAIEDFGMMHLAAPGPAFGEITGSYSLPVCDNWVEVYGTEGSARVGYWTGGPDLSVRAVGGAWEAVAVATDTDRFSGEIGHFLDCVRSGADPAVTAIDGQRGNDIVDAAYRSLREGRCIDLDLAGG